MWPRNHLLLVEVGRPGGRRFLIPVALAVVEDLVRSWLDLVHLTGGVILHLGLRRLLGRGPGWMFSLLGDTLRSRPGRPGLDGLWRVWSDVRRSGRRTLLELRPGGVEVSVRLW
ncbi:MAG: hypothetical protein AB1446_13015 [Bacillota bacterium]